MPKEIILTEEQFRNIILGVVNIEHSDLLEYYARVGFIGRKGELEVYIMTDDPGYIPHFHVRDTATKGKEFNTCIRLDTNEYFLHGTHTDILNSKQRRALAEFMESAYQNDKFENNYQFALEMWNMNNSSMNVEYTGKIPNYREIQ